MTFSATSSLWLFLALAFAGAALLGEFVALSQMRRREYRFVQTVCTLRRGQYMSQLCCVAFIGCAAMVNGRGTFVGLAVGTLVGGILAVPMFVGGFFYQPLLRLVIPVNMLFVVVVNSAKLASVPSLELRWPQFVTTAAICGLLSLIAQYRHLQAMERWRD